MFAISIYIGVVVLVVIGPLFALFAFWKYKKLEKLVEGTRKDLTDCQYSIEVINAQLDSFRDTIKRIDTQITDLETKVSTKTRTKGTRVLKNKE